MASELVANRQSKGLSILNASDRLDNAIDTLSSFIDKVQEGLKPYVEQGQIKKDASNTPLAEIISKLPDNLDNKRTQILNCVERLEGLLY